MIGRLQVLREDLKQKFNHAAFEIPYPTLNFGQVSGGDSPNRICGQSEIQFDLRPLPGLDLDYIQQLIAQTLEPVRAQWGSCFEIKMLHKPIIGYECAADLPFVGELEKLSGHSSETVSYCTEASYLQDVCPTLIVGPGYIDQAHQANEYLEYKFIEPTKKMLSGLVNKYSAK